MKRSNIDDDTPIEMPEPGIGEHKGLSKLKSRGGKGQEGVGMVDGTVMTLKETAALTIAKDVIDDAVRGTGKKIGDLTLMELARYAEGRTEKRPCSDAQVLAEITRLQNHEIYGDRVARR